MLHQLFRFIPPLTKTSLDPAEPRTLVRFSWDNSPTGAARSSSPDVRNTPRFWLATHVSVTSSLMKKKKKNNPHKQLRQSVYPPILFVCRIMSFGLASISHLSDEILQIKVFNESKGKSLTPWAFYSTQSPKCVKSGVTKAALMQTDLKERCSLATSNLPWGSGACSRAGSSPQIWWELGCRGQGAGKQDKWSGEVKLSFTLNLHEIWSISQNRVSMSFCSFCQTEKLETNLSEKKEVHYQSHVGLY